jgi:hypothetical protein
MEAADLSEWIDEFSGTDFVWLLKRLSANDTLAKGTRQAGPHFPKEIFFRIFPNHSEKQKPELSFKAFIDSHPDNRQVRAVWHNNRLNGKTRDEVRMVGFGGAGSALLDPENTGAIAAFAFRIQKNGMARECHIWVCRLKLEEDYLENRIGIVEPSMPILWSAEKGATALPFLLYAPPE